MSFRPTRPMINCGQCGEHLFVPQWTEYVDEYRVRHFGNARHATMSLRLPLLMRRFDFVTINILKHLHT